jgi:hypothetical protein
LRWLAPWEKVELKRAPIYHQPMYEGDFQGFLKQPTLFEVYGSVGYAEGEKKLLWDLPGHGKQYADCGKVKAKGCDNHKEHENGLDFVRLFKRSCRRKGCPVCFESWGSAEGERALIRLAAFKSGSIEIEKLILRVKRDYRKEPRQVFHEQLVEQLESHVHVGRQKPIHVVFSPPQELMKDSILSYRKVKEVAYDLAREHGLFGGALVFHPYRLKCSMCGSAIPDYHKNCPVCGKEAFSWFWSPHFHAIGFGWIHHTAEGYERTGWIVKNLGIRKSVFFTMQYLLSHAGVSQLHTTTWFGKLSYNSMGSVPILGACPEICPHCEKSLRPIQWIRTDRPPPSMELEKDPYANQFLAEPGSWRRV